MQKPCCAALCLLLPQAWPVMGVIGFAVSFVTYWSFSTLLTHPDVRIDRADRQSVIRAKRGENAEQEA